MVKYFFKHLLTWSCVFGGVISPSFTFSEGVQEECAKDLLLTYFPEPFVEESLKKFHISQEQVEKITVELASKDRDVVRTVEERASKMDPNPLKDPQARQAAIKLFRETLFQIFADVLKTHGINDDQQIHAMLDDVQQQKAERFALCMQKLVDTDAIHQE